MFRNTQEFKYREKLLFAEDYDLFLQILLKENYEIHLLDEILVSYFDIADWTFDDYLCNQAYYSEVAKYLYFEEKDNMKDRYDEFDRANVMEYVPEEIMLEMEMKKAFFNEKDFKKARKYINRLIEMDPSSEWRIYYIDSFFKGWLRRIAKPLKRRLKYRK
jgi:tetratricopeptide (TPR) repeat protein